MKKSDRPVMHPAAMSWVASFCAAGLLGLMANRPWYAGTSFVIAFGAGLLGWDWTREP